MCGIFGAVFEDVRDVATDRALHSIRERGPDASGVFEDGSVILGHRRLAILDLTVGGHQPMRSADGRAVIVFNGEIYNHHELRDDLRQRGHEFRSRSDTEVIIEGYREHGSSFLERLDGMFAIGIVDLERRRVVLARDRMGKKPLFFTRRSGGVRFASTIRALLASGISPNIDDASLPMLLALGYVPPTRTLYRNIEQLPPATIWELDENCAPQVRKYWSAPFDQPPLRVSDIEAERTVRKLVEAAVQRRLEADVPLGAFLSGGIDSTIVVGTMAKASSQRVRTFSIGFAGDRRFDETRYARIAAQAFDTDHTEFTLEPSAFELLDNLVEAHDGPFGDSSAIPTSVVSMLTRQHVTVALSGDGGDELFAGYTRFLRAKATERIPVPMRNMLAKVAGYVPHDRAKRFLQVSAMPLVDRMFAWQSYFSDDLSLVVHRDRREEWVADEALRWSRALTERTRASSPLTRALQYNFDSYLPYDLLVKADRSSMLHSLEVRSPFLDTALVNYASRLPDNYRVRGRATKWLLRRAFRDILPREILRRGKMGFGMPLGTWFRSSLRTFVRDTLGDNARIGAYLDMARVKTMLDEHDQKRRDLQHPIWLLLTLERWLHLLPQWSALPHETKAVEG